MKIPHWLEELLGAGALDVGVGGLAIPLLISILKKSIAQKPISAPAPAGEASATEKAEELKLTTAFLKAMGELGALPGCESYPGKINQFLSTKLPHDWQKKNFRKEIGRLANVTYETVGDVLEKKDWTKTTPRKNAMPIIEETHEEKRVKLTGNLGFDFLKSFGKLTEDQMYAVCDTAGILHSDLHSELESIDKGLKKIDPEAKKLAREIEKVIYARDDRGRILKNADGKKVLKDKFQYAGFLKSGLPKKRFVRWTPLAFAVIVAAMIAAGFIWS